jgi:hypothetical protein
MHPSQPALPVASAHDPFVVESDRLDAEGRQRVCDHWHAIGLIVTEPTEHTRAIAVAAADEASCLIT